MSEDAVENTGSQLLVNVHSEIIASADVVTNGTYKYFHYQCDGVDDRGWGCGYRTLQTLCSWVYSHPKFNSTSTKLKTAPTIREIQEALVTMEDKLSSFIDSRQWIGSFEVCLCLDYFYDVPCKIIHVNKGAELQSKLPELKEHFLTVGAPVMMGGETDNASKGIMGVRLESSELLIVDPHFSGKNPSVKELHQSGFLKWLPVQDLHSDSFYNLCLPKPVWR